MKTVLKFVLLDVILNLARYLLGWYSESWFVLPGMFGVIVNRLISPGLFKTILSE